MSNIEHRLGVRTFVVSRIQYTQRVFTKKEKERETVTHIVRLKRRCIILHHQYKEEVPPINTIMCFALTPR